MFREQCAKMLRPMGIAVKCLTAGYRKAREVVIALKKRQKLRHKSFEFKEAQDFRNVPFIDIFVMFLHRCFAFPFFLSI